MAVPMDGSSIHFRINRDHPKKGVCEWCGRRRKDDERAFQLAFKRHPQPYTENREDYMELCMSCHVKLDIVTGARPRPTNNWRSDPSESGRRGAAGLKRFLASLGDEERARWYHERSKTRERNKRLRREATA
jgi:hypothetical protein